MKTDNELIADYFEGDAQSLEILIRRHLGLVYRTAYRYIGNPHDAEDIAQETFMKMWRNLKKFDSAQEFKPWLFTIAKHAALDFLKKKKTVPFSKFENENGENLFADSLADYALLPDALSEKSDMARMLNAAVEKLSQKYRAVLRAYYNGDATFREIAWFSGEPLHTVKSRHRRALAALRRIITNSECSI